MIEAVIFDLDGTLVDHAAAQAVALAAGLARLSLVRSHADRDAPLVRWRQLEREYMDRYLAGDCTFAEQRRKRLRAFLPIFGVAIPDDAEIDGWWSAYANDYESAWTCYPDVVPCLEALAALPSRPRLGVLTNGDGSQQRAKLTRFGLLDRFDDVSVSSETGVAKPAPESFISACRALGVEPRHALFVGDWLELDALGATAAGLIGVWLDRDDGDLRPPCPRITTLLQLPGLASRPPREASST